MDEIWQRPDPALAAAGVEGEWLVARVRLFAVTLLLITPTYKLIQYPQIPVFVWGFWVTFVRRARGARDLAGVAPPLLATVARLCVQHARRLAA